MGLTEQIKKTALKTAFSYLEKNPEENAPRLMPWVDKLAGAGPNSFQTQRDAVRRVIEAPDNNMRQPVMDVLTQTDSEALKATFFRSANIIGWPVQEKRREQYGCSLHCTGCRAAEYGNKLNLTFDEIDSSITQGKKLGVHRYIYTGGEPLVRKADLMALCEKHSGCQFPAFTNGMLSDDAFAHEMLRAKKFIPAISLKGSEDAGGVLCTTFSVNMDQCRDCFALRAEAREAVVCAALSGEMSSCCQNACRAAEAFGNVQVADSRTLSSGREIADLLRAETARMHSSFLRHRLDSMRKGCRCSAVAALIANLMHLKPCIAVHDSAMGVVKTYRGSFAVPAPAAAWPSPCIPPHPSAGGCFRAVWRARTGCTVPCHC